MRRQASDRFREYPLVGEPVALRSRLDDRNGKILWEMNLGAPVSGFPITFAVDGRQYVAVSTGTALATNGTRGLTPELRPSQGNNLYVFALPN